MLIKNNTKEKGFTLIELMVSIALFSVVLVVTLGSIITIADSNKKARSLMSVMNNLNFSIDSMTRSIKAGKIGTTGGVTNAGKCFTTEQINYNNAGTFDRERVEYCLEEDADGNGRIDKKIGSGAAVPLTSPDVDVDYLKFTAYNGGVNRPQPRVLIVLEGTVKVSEKISSRFTIQTTVAQRQLNI